MTSVRKIYCRPCAQERLFQRPTPDPGLHRFLTVLTLGLWGLCWIALYLYYSRKPWVCSFCWHRVWKGRKVSGAGTPVVSNR